LADSAPLMVNDAVDAAVAVVVSTIVLKSDPSGERRLT
jgi:hypothetical protein